MIRSMLSGILALAACVPAAVSAEPTITRVEEDWVVYIKNPDADAGAPQITNILAPTSSLEGAFGLVELNHRSAPSFDNGGYQVQSWVGETLSQYRESVEHAAFRNQYDKLTYTVSMETAADSYVFGIKDGRSRSWGKFAEEELTSSVPADSLSLAEYDPQFSVDSTSINVGAHRVEVMYQREVRYYAGDTLVKEDNTPRIIHRFQEVVQFVSLEEYENNEEYFNINIADQ